MPIADFTRGVSVEEDVVRWSRSHPPEAPLEYPPLVWVAAPEIVRSARMSADGSRISSDAGSCVLSLMPKIALNRSYYNDASTGFLTQRTLTLRGQSSEGRFIARTIWPDDFRLDRAAPERRIDATALGLRSLVREVDFASCAPQGNLLDRKLLSAPGIVMAAVVMHIGDEQGLMRHHVHDNGAIGWKLLQSMAKMLRANQHDDPPPAATTTDGSQ